LQVVQPGQLEALPFQPPAITEHLVQIFMATIQVGAAREVGLREPCRRR
jgi:hypothetical protein